MTQQRHLILGGGGFIGRHVALLLARTGHRVTIATRAVPLFKFPTEVIDCIELVEVELAAADWDALVAEVDVVHHYAWSSTPASANANPAGDMLVNIGSILGLLDAMRRRGGGRLVFPSSGGTVYGRLKAVPAHEDTPLAPITAYGAGKATAEVYLNLYRELYGLDCRIARIGNPYGPGQDPTRGLGAVSTFIHRALGLQEIIIWGDGEIVRDYIHISDVASALVNLSCSALSATDFIFNIGSGIGITLNEVITALEQHLGRDIRVSRQQHSRPFDVPVSVLAIDRAKRVLNWSPKLSLAEGIQCTVADVEAHLPFSRLQPIDLP